MFRDQVELLISCGIEEELAGIVSEVMYEAVRPLFTSGMCIPHAALINDRREVTEVMTTNKPIDQGTLAVAVEKYREEHELATLIVVQDGIERCDCDDSQPSQSDKEDAVALFIWTSHRTWIIARGYCLIGDGSVGLTEWVDLTESRVRPPCGLEHLFCSGCCRS